MRLPYDIKSKINKFISRGPSTLLTATTWEPFKDTWRTSDHRYIIIKDDKYGYVISERINAF